MWLRVQNGWMACTKSTQDISLPEYVVNGMKGIWRSSMSYFILRV